jgi:DNA-3-methyladenine glycosylase II
VTLEKIELRAKPPFRLDLTVWALRRRRQNAVDRWNGEQYDRIFVVNNKPVRLTISQRQDRATPTLDVDVESARKLRTQDTEALASCVRRTFGLTTDLRPFYELAGRDAHLKTLAERFSGVKPPRFPSLFEALVNAVACQQVTLDLGIVLLNRLSEQFGACVVDRGTSLNAFPMPTDIVDVSEESIKELGFSRQKARVIKDLAVRVSDGTLDVQSLDGLANEAAVAYLSNLRGIGRWSAEYALLRGLGRLDTFPGDDIGAQNNLRRMFHLDDKPNYEAIRKLTSAWHPYEGVVYFHLLLEKLHGAGAI